MTEDEVVGWQCQFDGCDFKQALGVGDGQGSLRCCNPWGHKELDTTELTDLSTCLSSLITPSLHAILSFNAISSDH